MKKLFFLPLLLVSWICLYGQPASDTLINKQTKFELKNDTLFASTGLKIYPGQKFIIGQPAGENGFFRSIVSKRAALVPSIWGQDMRYEYAIENHVNKKKSREAVKEAMIPGNTVTVKKIIFSKTAKPNFYFVSLSTDTDTFGCDIKFALLLGELSSLQ